jgi:hypothetical protein
MVQGFLQRQHLLRAKVAGKRPSSAARANTLRPQGDAALKQATTNCLQSGSEWWELEENRKGSVRACTPDGAADAMDIKTLRPITATIREHLPV